MQRLVSLDSSLLSSLLSKTMATLSATASLLLSSLKEASREDGVFLSLSSSAPSWAQDVIREAHLGEFPNDSRYEAIREALSSLSAGGYEDAGEAQEDLLEISLNMLPCYTSDLLQWFSAHNARLSRCDDALSDGRVSEVGAYELLSEGFRIDAEEMLSSLISSLEEEREALFDPDQDVKLLLSDSHGIYIPQLYCSDITEEDCEDLSISWEDVKACQQGPDSALYWDSWQSILDSAEYEEDRIMWRLVQNSDLWAVRSDAEIPEAWF